MSGRSALLGSCRLDPKVLPVSIAKNDSEATAHECACNFGDRFGCDRAGSGEPLLGFGFGAAPEVAAVGEPEL
jgi:hypothetical protein